MWFLKRSDSKTNVRPEVSVQLTDVKIPKLTNWLVYICHQGTRRYFSVDRGILLIRNPYDAILAEFNRETDPKPPHFGHTLIRSREDFRTSRFCLSTSVWISWWIWWKSGCWWWYEFVVFPQHYKSVRDEGWRTSLVWALCIFSLFISP